MKRDMTDYPPITKRIMLIVNERYGGNVNKFCQALGLQNSVKVNRLFKRDTRNNEYPTPSTDIILLISNTEKLSTDWLLKGGDAPKDMSEFTTEDSPIIEMLKYQQAQLDKIMQFILEK